MSKPAIVVNAEKARLNTKIAKKENDIRSLQRQLNSVQANIQQLKSGNDEWKLSVLERVTSCEKVSFNNFFKNNSPRTKCNTWEAIQLYPDLMSQYSQDQREMSGILQGGHTEPAIRYMRSEQHRIFYKYIDLLKIKKTELESAIAKKKEMIALHEAELADIKEMIAELQLKKDELIERKSQVLPSKSRFIPENITLPYIIRPNGNLNMNAKSTFINENANIGNLFSRKGGKRRHRNKKTRRA